MKITMRKKKPEIIAYVFLAINLLWPSIGMSSTWLNDSMPSGLVYSGPKLDGTNIFLGGLDGKLYGINKNDGSDANGYPVTSADGAIYGDICIDGSTIYAASIDGKLYSIDTSTKTSTVVFTSDSNIYSRCRIDK